VTRAPLLLGVVGLLAPALAGCGTSNVDTAGMERQLQQRITRELELEPGEVKAECPREAEAKAGNTFTCTLRYDDDELVLDITLQEGGRYQATPRTATTP